MGQLAMGCEGEWLYNWMSHLHSSQPPFKDCADDPTKSIDMAFYLIDAGDGVCSITALPCQVDADCPAGDTCVTSEVFHWCQPVNPGPPIYPVPPPVFPPGGVHELSLTVADVVVNLDFIPVPLELHFEGPTVVWHANREQSRPPASIWHSPLTNRQRTRR